jgi:uncharacterized protein (TIGR02599 family)
MYPEWLKPFLGGTKRFRLVQLVEPAEKLKIYASTGSSSYDLAWLQPFAAPQAASRLRARVLAEDVPLLVIRPRPAPEDEKAVAPLLGETYNDSQPGSILCPNYHYDSRAWQSGYPASQRVKATPSASARVELMRNQVPPIVDVTILCVDRRSLGRFDQGGATPPAPLQIPAGFFTDSTKFEADLAAYGKQLSDSGIRYRVFRSSVRIQGAKWSNQ